MGGNTAGAQGLLWCWGCPKVGRVLSSHPSQGRDMKENMAEARCFNCLRLQNRISWPGRQKGRLEGELWGKQENR